MGGEGYRNSKPQESVPPDSIPAEVQIKELQAEMAAKRKARQRTSGGISVEEVSATPNEDTDSDFDSEKVALGNERVSITDYKTITLNTKSGNTYILRRGDGVYTLFNVRAKSIVEIDFSKIQELDLSRGKPFVYGRNRDGKKIQTAVVTSGEGTLL